ncbi:MAG TPA: methyltransferase domain-containing protein [Ilumatobacteraceae bacterium]|nr:methyltransferase domain-containing protein [Ilumatobacteraceae bacterium]
MTDTGPAAGWDGDEAHHWVTEADRYDGQLAPFVELLFDRLNLDSGDAALDVGCGCGATTIHAAQMSRTAVGVDLSSEMLAVGQQRAADAGVTNVEFFKANAARHPFTAETFDAIVSRFGVMFFDDPVSAFTNLRRALRVDGRLVFVCWQGMEANPWLLVPGVAAAAHVPLPDLGESGGPGRFSLADREHLTTVMSAAGFSNIEVESVSPLIILGGGGSLEETVEFLLGTGIARALFDGAEPDARRRAIDAVTGALAECYQPGRGVVLGTGAWLVSVTRRR